MAQWLGLFYTALRAQPRHRHRRAARERRMDDILNQQANLLRFGEDLLRESSRKLREAAGPDALRQAYDLWRGFVEAVDWSETWIRCLLGFHLTMLALALVTRKSESAQTIIFLACMCLVLSLIHI